MKLENLGEVTGQRDAPLKDALQQVPFFRPKLDQTKAAPGLRVLLALVSAFDHFPTYVA